MESQGGSEVEKRPNFIKIEAVEETPRQKEVRAVAEEARSTALGRLGGASDLTDYMRWHRAASVYLIPANIDWMWDYGSTTSADLIAEQESARFTKGYARNVIAAEALKPALDTLPPQEGMIRVGLKRVRDDHERYDYRVLAAFPEGTQVSDPLDEAIKTTLPRGGGDTVFFEPETACVSHACDDLYKVHRDAAFYMPVKTLSDAIRGLQADEKGANEYLLARTETGSVKQDAENFLLVGLLGGYGNERFRARVSDYWNRPKPQVATTAGQ